MKAASYYITVSFVFFTIFSFTYNQIQKQECSNTRVHFVLDINRPGIIPPTSITDEKTGKDPFGVRWNEESGKLSFVGGLQAREKGEFLKELQFNEKFILSEKNLILTTTLAENVVDYWKKVLEVVFDESKILEEKQLDADNKVLTSHNSFSIFVNKFYESRLTHGFLINSKVCPNIFKEAKKLFTKDNIERFYNINQELLQAAIAIENIMIGKKFNAVYNGNKIFKLEIKRNDLINNPNLLKRMVTYFEADLYKSTKLNLFDEQNVLNLRKKIIEKFELKGGLANLITQSFMKYIINNYLVKENDILGECNDKTTKYFSITTTDINIIALQKSWRKLFPEIKLRIGFPKFSTSYIFLFEGPPNKIDTVKIFEDHMLLGKIDFETFIERFYLRQDFETETLNKFCSESE